MNNNIPSFSNSNNCYFIMPILLNCTEDGLDADINTDVDLKEQF